MSVLWQEKKIPVINVQRKDFETLAEVMLENLPDTIHHWAKKEME